MSITEEIRAVLTEVVVGSPVITKGDPGEPGVATAVAPLYVNDATNTITLDEADFVHKSQAELITGAKTFQTKVLLPNTPWAGDPLGGSGPTLPAFGFAGAPNTGIGQAGLGVLVGPGLMTIHSEGNYAGYMGLEGGVFHFAARGVPGLNRMQIASGAAMVLIANTGHFELETGHATEPIEILGYRAGTAEGRSIVFKTEPTSQAVPLIVQGPAAPTVDLQQWKNSAGTVLASLTSGGDFIPTGWVRATTYGSQSQLQTIRGATTVLATQVGQIPLLVQGAVGQTGDLQQWQASGGGVLARVSSAGRLTAPEIDVGAVQVRDLGTNLYLPNAGTWVTGLSRIFGGANMSGTPMTANAASTVGFIVKGFAAQTADLQQWQDSAGAVLARVTSTGVVTGFGFSPPSQTNPVVQGFSFSGNDTLIRANSGAAVHIGDAAGAATRFAGGAASPASAATVAFVVRGAASQTADLEQWQSSTGAVLASVDAGGSLNAPGLYAKGTSLVISAAAVSTSLNFRNATLNAQSAAYTPIVVKGAASQSADLQQWQDSAGAVLSKVTATGVIHSSSYLLSAASGSYNSLSAASYFGYEASSAYPMAKFTAAVPAQIPFVVKGAASQTAPLQEWQDSAGTPLTRIGPAGQLSTSQVFTSGALAGLGGAPQAWFTTPANNLIPLAVRGHASQAADLQQWQTGAGTAVTYVTATGRLVAPDATIPTIYSNGIEKADGLAGVSLYSTGVLIQSRAATNVAIVIRGHATQSTDLQQWQNSGGGTIAKVNSAGSARFVSAGIGADPISDLGLFVYPQAASFRPLVVRAFASQTADLTQWQGNDGVPLAKINNTGGLSASNVFTPYVQSVAQTGSYLSVEGAGLVAQGRGASLVVLTVAGVATQTADLQQWRNSAGTTLSKVKADGSLDLTFAGPAFTGNLVVNNTTATGYGAIFKGGVLGAQFVTGAVSSVGVEVRWGQAGQTADLMVFKDNSGASLLSVLAAGDLDFLSSTRGPLLRSPSGNRYRLTVSDIGSVAAVAA